MENKYNDELERYEKSSRHTGEKNTAAGFMVAGIFIAIAIIIRTVII